MTSTFEDTQKRLTEVFQHIELTDDVEEKLTHPKLALSVSIPIRMDDGSLKVFTCHLRRGFNSRRKGYSSPA